VAGNGSDLVSAIAALMGAIIGAAATVGGQWWFERRRAGMRARLVLGQLSALLDTLKDTEAETNVRKAAATKLQLFIDNPSLLVKNGHLKKLYFTNLLRIDVEDGGFWVDNRLQTDLAIAIDEAQKPFTDAS
jgi:hypothetical protein